MYNFAKLIKSSLLMLLIPYIDFIISIVFIQGTKYMMAHASDECP